MGFFKKQLLEVIEWNDASKDVIVYRYPLVNREEIMNSSTLVVREGQTAIFMHNGESADVFGPGTYKLATERKGLNFSLITEKHKELNLILSCFISDLSCK